MREAEHQAPLGRLLHDVETVVTRSAKEALLLENNLIKLHRPRFNVMLRDDKNFLVIRLDARVAWPRAEMVRRIGQDGAHYFGPHHSATSARATLKVLNLLGEESPSVLQPGDRAPPRGTPRRRADAATGLSVEIRMARVRKLANRHEPRAGPAVALPARAWRSPRRVLARRSRTRLGVPSRRCSTEWCR